MDLFKFVMKKAVSVLDTVVDNEIEKMEEQKRVEREQLEREETACAFIAPRIAREETAALMQDEGDLAEIKINTIEAFQDKVQKAVSFLNGEDCDACYDFTDWNYDFQKYKAHMARNLGNSISSTDTSFSCDMNLGKYKDKLETKVIMELRTSSAKNMMLGAVEKNILISLEESLDVESLNNELRKLTQGIAEGETRSIKVKDEYIDNKYMEAELQVKEDCGIEALVIVSIIHLWSKTPEEKAAMLHSEAQAMFREDVILLEEKIKLIEDFQGLSDKGEAWFDNDYEEYDGFCDMNVEDDYVSVSYRRRAKDETIKPINEMDLSILVQESSYNKHLDLELIDVDNDGQINLGKVEQELIDYLKVGMKVEILQGIIDGLLQKTMEDHYQSYESKEKQGDDREMRLSVECDKRGQATISIKIDVDQDWDKYLEDDADEE